MGTIAEICNMALLLLVCETAQQISNLTERFDQLKEKCEDAFIEWVSLL